MFIFYVQGGGLGHLTRVDRLIKTLKLPEKEIVIMTPSVFTCYFPNYKFILLEWTSSANDWSQHIESLILTTKVTQFYVDTFPLGLKGELCAVFRKFPKLKYVYISRILKWEAYLKAHISEVNIQFDATILLEPLYESHLTWINNQSKLTKKIALQLDHRASVKYSEEPYVLVVHSGGTADVVKLIERAVQDYKNEEHIIIVVFTQVELSVDNANVVVHKSKFPVSQYYEHALKIYTAGGFNSVFELNEFREKHIIMAFDKLYDDQEFRIKNLD
ncbi:hypothetical protein [Psychroserpens sp.]|uniref:hypothetical protein n=1 Tax=Psychroserpens sp. TaxID=2020870 RepID=UPI003C74C206